MDSFTIVILIAGLCFLFTGVYYLFSLPRMSVSKHGIRDIAKWRKVHRFIWIVSLIAGILLIFLSLAPLLCVWKKTLLFERGTSLIVIMALLLILTGIRNLNSRA